MVSVSHLHAPAVSVAEQLLVVRNHLARSGTSSFRALTADCGTTNEVVARFLALLELYRQQRVGLRAAHAAGGAARALDRPAAGDDEPVPDVDDYEGRCRSTTSATRTTTTTERATRRNGDRRPEPRTTSGRPSPGTRWPRSWPRPGRQAAAAGRGRPDDVGRRRRRARRPGGGAAGRGAAARRRRRRRSSHRRTRRRPTCRRGSRRPDEPAEEPLELLDPVELRAGSRRCCSSWTTRSTRRRWRGRCAARSTRCGPASPSWRRTTTGAGRAHPAPGGGGVAALHPRGARPGRRAVPRGRAAQPADPGGAGDPRRHRLPPAGHPGPHLRDPRRRGGRRHAHADHPGAGARGGHRSRQRRRAVRDDPAVPGAAGADRPGRPARARAAAARDRRRCSTSTPTPELAGRSVAPQPDIRAGNVRLRGDDGAGSPDAGDGRAAPRWETGGR